MDIIPQPNFAIQKIGLSKLNEMFGCLENFYFSVYQLDYYLPPFKCPTITADYLSGVCKGIFHSSKRNQILPGGAQCVKKKYQRQGSMRYYQIQLRKRTQVTQGLTYINCLLKSIFQMQFMLLNRQILFSFQGLKMIELITKLTSQLNMRIVPDEQGTIFKRTKEQILKDTLKSKQDKIKKRKQRIQRLVEETRKAEQIIEDLENDMEEIQNN